MRPYLDLLHTVLNQGVYKADRTGVGTKSIFGAQLRFTLTDGFPLLTVRRLHWRSIVYELLWFLQGDTNVRYLQENGVSIWNEWADANGDLGPIYGYQWRQWRRANGDTIDQLSDLMEELKRNPDSRRLIVSAWNVAEIHLMKLPPCHVLYQFYVANGCLSCQVYQRSADLFLGVPFNIASYALLTHIVAAQAGYRVGDLIWTGGDCHLYANHHEQAKELLSRSEKPLPRLVLRIHPASLFDYQFDNFDLQEYDPHPAIVAPVAV